MVVNENELPKQGVVPVRKKKRKRSDKHVDANHYFWNFVDSQASNNKPEMPLNLSNQNCYVLSGIPELTSLEVSFEDFRQGQIFGLRIATIPIVLNLGLRSPNVDKNIVQVDGKFFQNAAVVLEVTEGTLAVEKFKLGDVFAGDVAGTLKTVREAALAINSAKASKATLSCQVFRYSRCDAVIDKDCRGVGGRKDSGEGVLSKRKHDCPIFERESAFLSSYERATFKTGHREILNEEGKGDDVITDQIQKYQKDVDIERVEVNCPDISRAGVNDLNCSREKEKSNKILTNRDKAKPNFGKMGIKKNNAEDSKHQEVEKEKVYLNTEKYRCRKEEGRAVKKSFRNEVDKPEEVKSNAETQNCITHKKFQFEADSQEEKRHTSGEDFRPAIVKSATHDVENEIYIVKECQHIKAGRREKATLTVANEKQKNIEGKDHRKEGASNLFSEANIRTADELETNGSYKSSVDAKNKKFIVEKARLVDADSKMKTGKKKRTADSASIFETNHQKKAKYDGEGESHFEAYRQKTSKFDAEEKKRIADEAKRREKARLDAEEKKRIADEAKRREKARLDDEEKKRNAEEAKRREKARLDAEEKKRNADETKRREKARLDAEEKKRNAEEAKHREKARLDAEEKKRIADEAKRRGKARLDAEEKKRNADEAKHREKARLDDKEKKRIADEAKRREKAKLDDEEKKRNAEEAKGREKARLDAEEKKRNADEAKRREKARLDDKEKKRNAEEAKGREKARLDAEEKKRNSEEAKGREKARLDPGDKKRKATELDCRGKSRLDGEKKNLIMKDKSPMEVDDMHKKSRESPGSRKKAWLDFKKKIRMALEDQADRRKKSWLDAEEKIRKDKEHEMVWRKKATRDAKSDMVKAKESNSKGQEFIKETLRVNEEKLLIAMEEEVYRRKRAKQAFLNAEEKMRIAQKAEVDRQKKIWFSIEKKTMPEGKILEKYIADAINCVEKIVHEKIRRRPAEERQYIANVEVEQQTQKTEVINQNSSRNKVQGTSGNVRVENEETITRAPGVTNKKMVEHIEYPSTLGAAEASVSAQKRASRWDVDATCNTRVKSKLAERIINDNTSNAISQSSKRNRSRRWDIPSSVNAPGRNEKNDGNEAHSIRTSNSSTTEQTYLQNRDRKYDIHSNECMKRRPMQDRGDRNNEENDQSRLKNQSSPSSTPPCDPISPQVISVDLPSRLSKKGQSLSNPYPADSASDLSMRKKVNDMPSRNPAKNSSIKNRKGFAQHSNEEANNKVFEEERPKLDSKKLVKSDDEEPSLKIIVQPGEGIRGRYTNTSIDFTVKRKFRLSKALKKIRKHIGIDKSLKIGFLSRESSKVLTTGTFDSLSIPNNTILQLVEDKDN